VAQRVRLVAGQALAASVMGLYEGTGGGTTQQRAAAQQRAADGGTAPTGSEVVGSGQPKTAAPALEMQKNGLTLAARIPDPSVPRARLVLRLFAEASGGTVLHEQEDYLDNTASWSWQQLAVGKLATVDCWAEVYVENLSSQAVWFDDLEIATGALPVAIVVQETHYDPWGLELAGIGYNASGNPEHRWKFNGGVERMADFGLHWDESGARMYDMQVPRFLGVDPLADEEGQESWTPYHYGLNNPIRYNDPKGMLFGDIYNMNGTHIGTDGKDDNRVFVSTTTDDKQLTQTKASELINQTDAINTLNVSCQTAPLIALSVGHDEFKQLAAFAFNETYQTNTEENRKGKFAVASAIVNDAEAREIGLQKALDHARFGGDSHQERMSAESANPPSGKKVPNTSIEYSNVKTGAYQEFYNSTPEARNANSAMKTATSAAVNALTGGKDHSNGGTNWGGGVPSYGTQTATAGGNKFYKLTNPTLYKYGN
jgi:RHS repeat-associated protein